MTLPSNSWEPSDRKLRGDETLREKSILGSTKFDIFGTNKSDIFWMELIFDIFGTKKISDLRFRFGTPFFGVILYVLLGNFYGNLSGARPPTLPLN